MIIAILFAISVRAETFYELPNLFHGEIQDRTSKALLYNYTRSVTKVAETTTVKREFNTPDGKTAAIETVTLKNGKATKMDLDQKQTGEKGFFEVRGKKLHFEYTNGDKKKQDDEDVEDDTICSDEVVPYLQKHWTELMKGDTLHVRFPVITRAETVGFKFFKDKEDSDGIYMKMKPSSIVIAALVSPLVFKFQKAEGHKVVWVDGRVTPKKKDGAAWRDLDALFVMKYDEVATSKDQPATSKDQPAKTK